MDVPYIPKITNTTNTTNLDGQNSDIIMRKGGDICTPRTICFSRDFKKLFVSNEGGKRVVVYNCEY
jgi:hypothetical protein